MKNRLFFLTSGLALIIGLCCNSNQTKRSSDVSQSRDTSIQTSSTTSAHKTMPTERSNSTSDEQIISLCENFYISYITEISEGTLVNSDKRLDSIKQIYCTSDLLKNFWRKMENNEMDWDPFIKAQDANIKCLKTLNVGKNTQQINWYFVSYIDNYNGEKVVIELKYIKDNGSYKIDSIR